MSVKSIKRKILGMGLGAESLDDLVHEAASALASDTNNSGIEDQIRFLVSQGYTEEEILKNL